MRQEVRFFKKEVAKTLHLGYLVFLPQGYGANPQQKWPLLLYLHGMGERGTNPATMILHGLREYVEQTDDFPFVLVAPQCPPDSWWEDEIEALDALLDELLAKYALDAERVYLTGISMGGYGTWRFVLRHPERFAAIAPVCGGGIPALTGVFKEVPVWAFHGAKDTSVPLSASESMVSALQARGGDARLSVFPDGDHHLWNEAYKNPELYAWFLRHRRRGRT
ncbi:MAG: prolyl oligopeptidase family serine peptidase [Anaerolineae bacterium]|nr:prolyl oligopeptidase family serine peptidase [Anaerolineae bacterium]